MSFSKAAPTTKPALLSLPASASGTKSVEQGSPSSVAVIDAVAELGKGFFVKLEGSSKRRSIASLMDELVACTNESFVCMAREITKLAWDKTAQEPFKL